MTKWQWAVRCAPGGTVRRWLIPLAAIGVVLVAPAWGKLETWRQEGAPAFAKHHRERVVISDQGKIRLGQALVPTGPLAAERVWDLARAKDGTIYAATGDSGKVFRRPTRDNAAWTVALDAADSQALTLASLPDGKVFVGTGPSGQVIEVTDPQHPASRPDPKVQYIWDLAADADGNLFAATGPTGQLWKRSKEGKWSLAYDSKATHLLSVAVGSDGYVYAGSDGEGLIYRVGKDGKVAVLYDAPQSEIRTLIVAADGSLYAGTAAEAGGGGQAPSRGNAPFTLRGPDREFETSLASAARAAPAHPRRPIRLASAQVSPPPPARPGTVPARPAQGGSAAPKPTTPGDNAVYRIEPDGVVREVFRAKAMVFALAWSGERLLVGTGPEGMLYEIRDRGAESTPLAKLDNGQILSLLAEPDGSILLGTGDPGSVVKLSSDHVAQGEIVSEVFDAKLLSRFGALSWRADAPAGTSIAIQARTGNVGEPDETWSSWSADQTDPANSRAESPPGRFVQYRAKLATKDPQRSPELSMVALSYRSINLPPEINKLEVPDVGAGDGTAKQTRLNLRWDVSDPNDDELHFLVQVRKDGWPSWITLTETPLTDKTYAWDTTAFPSGQYRVRVVASDRPSNKPEDAQTRERDSQPLLVDHESPLVAVTVRDRGASVVLSDALTRLVKADYALDGGPWTPIFPDDGLFDTSREQVTPSLPDLKPGVHLLMVRATDAAGNTGAGDALIVVRN